MSYGTLRLNNLSSEQFWNILLYTGYLTLEEHGDDGINRLRIPNRKVLQCFRDNISGYYEDTGSNEYGTLVRNLIDELLEGDSKKAQGSLRTLLRGYVSLRDNATRAPHENFYHGFLNGLLAAAGDYISDFQSQADAGSGYADITFSSYDGGSSVVIEVKYASDAKARLQDLASKAIAQIEEKGYAAGLCSEGSDRVVECGMAFRGRECAVRCKELLPDAD
ncbi:MAG: PD-(D/E)XK nuclease domain-containing protein [Proteobacteria bacterium]|nr:PD-(D/E)XK nuclease domain-containing protein [Pseudomonadota bacterium]